MIKNKQLKALLVKAHACIEAIDWLGERDLAAALAECERADWMLWLVPVNEDVL